MDDYKSTLLPQATNTEAFDEYKKSFYQKPISRIRRSLNILIKIIKNFQKMNFFEKNSIFIVCLFFCIYLVIRSSAPNIELKLAREKAANIIADAEKQRDAIINAQSKTNIKKDNQLATIYEQIKIESWRASPSLVRDEIIRNRQLFKKTILEFKNLISYLVKMEAESGAETRSQIVTDQVEFFPEIAMDLKFSGHCWVKTSEFNTFLILLSKQNIPADTTYKSFKKIYLPLLTMDDSADDGTLIYLLDQWRTDVNKELLQQEF